MSFSNIVGVISNSCTVTGMEITPRFLFCESQVRGTELHLRFADAPIGPLGADALCGTEVGWDQPYLVDLGVLPPNVCTVCAQLAQDSLRRYVRS